MTIYNINDFLDQSSLETPCLVIDLSVVRNSYIKIKKFFPGKAINLGFKQAKGKYLICLSAHCIPENEYWLKNLVKGFKNKKIAGILRNYCSFVIK